MRSFGPALIGITCGSLLSVLAFIGWLLVALLLFTCYDCNHPRPEVQTVGASGLILLSVCAFGCFVSARIIRRTFHSSRRSALAFVTLGFTPLGVLIFLVSTGSLIGAI
jgi:hypothetical protein